MKTLKDALEETKKQLEKIEAMLTKQEQASKKRRTNLRSLDDVTLKKPERFLLWEPSDG